MNTLKNAFNDTDRYIKSNDECKTKIENIIKFHLVKLCASVRYPEVIQLNKYFDSLYSSNQSTIESKVILNPNNFPIPISIELYSKLFTITKAQIFTIHNDENFITSSLETVLPIILSFLTSNDRRNCYNLRNLKDSERSFNVLFNSILFCQDLTKFLIHNNPEFTVETATSISIVICLSIIFDVDEETMYKTLNYLSEFNRQLSPRELVETFLLIFVQPNYQYSTDKPKFMNDLVKKWTKKSNLDGLFDDLHFSCYDNSPFWSIVTAILNTKIETNNSSNGLTVVKIKISDSLFPANEKLNNNISLDNGNQIVGNVELVEHTAPSDWFIELVVATNQQPTKYQFSLSESLNILKQYNNQTNDLYDQCIASTLGVYGAEQIEEAFSKLGSRDCVSLEVALSCFFDRPALD